ncbi:hypothetical protein VNO77_25762 [Canavalia gladiata]|uniref:Uncharacterized protein n=1 Tax=Canavalia gladiata TaxID=3824 RepID=A0AAN9Q910_CANGL
MMLYLYLIMDTQSRHHSCYVELRSPFRTASTINSGQPDPKRLVRKVIRLLPDGACPMKGMQIYRPHDMIIY